MEIEDTHRAPQEPGFGAEALEVGDRWVLRLGNWAVEVEPQQGARICSFSWMGRNLLTGPEVDPANFGSTFWTSPQTDWAWPPVPEVDNKPYSVVESDSGLVCVGACAVKLGVLVTKRFHVLPGKDALRVVYEVSNQTNETIRLAPWEISRVRGGLTFFATGEARYPKPPLPECPVQELDGVTWYKYDRETVKEDQKLFAHSGAGWLVHVDKDVALIKEFESIPAERQAPGEAMIELFASGERDYIEIEQQGAYSKISPWKSLTWEVLWRVRPLPKGVTASVGNSDLVQWVESMLKSEPKNRRG